MNSHFSVLVVEDDEPTRTLISNRLTIKGYKVAQAADGEEAYQQIKRAPPQAVICDIMMPKIDGLSLCRRLRAEGQNIPFLFLTAKGQTRDVVEGLSSGADDYMVKPFDARELEARLMTLLRRAHPLGV